MGVLVDYRLPCRGGSKTGLSHLSTPDWSFLMFSSFLLIRSFISSVSCSQDCCRSICISRIRLRCTSANSVMLHHEKEFSNLGRLSDPGSYFLIPPPWMLLECDFILRWEKDFLELESKSSVTEKNNWNLLKQKIIFNFTLLNLTERDITIQLLLQSY